jgi:hypothetical protein
VAAAQDAPTRQTRWCYGPCGHAELRAQTAADPDWAAFGSAQRAIPGPLAGFAHADLVSHAPHSGFRCCGTRAGTQRSRRHDLPHAPTGSMQVSSQSAAHSGTSYRSPWRACAVAHGFHRMAGSDAHERPLISAPQHLSAGRLNGQDERAGTSHAHSQRRFLPSRSSSVDA